MFTLILYYKIRKNYFNFLFIFCYILQFFYFFKKLRMSQDEYFPDLTATILIGWVDNYTTLRFSQFLYLILTESSSEKFYKYVSPKITEEGISLNVEDKFTPFLYFKKMSICRKENGWDCEEEKRIFLINENCRKILKIKGSSKMLEK